MKKLLVVLLALTALSVAAFADDVVWTYGLTVKTGATLTFGDSTSFPQATLVPYDADDSVASRLRFDAEATLGDFSAHIRVGGDNAGMDATGDVFLNAWWVNAYFLDKMVQLQFGNLDHSVSDSVNKGWGGLSVEGAQVVVVPITGLSVGASVPVNAAAGTFNQNIAGTRVGFAYTMPNTAIVKFTYINAPGDKQSDVAGGVEIDAIPNLKAQLEFQDTDLGSKVFVPSAGFSNLGVKTGAVELFEFASYAMGPLTPSLEMYQALPSDTSYKMQLYVKPGIDYVVMEGTAVGATVKWIYKPAFGLAGTGDNGLVIDPYVAFTFNAKAALKIDAAYTLPDLSSTGTWGMPININFKFSY